MFGSISDRFTVLAVASVLGVPTSRVTELEQGIQEYFPSFTLASLTDVVTGKSNGALLPPEILSSEQNKDDARSVLVRLIAELDPNGDLQVKIGDAIKRYRADLLMGKEFDSLADLLIDGVAPLLVKNPDDICECGAQKEVFNLPGGTVLLCPVCE